MRGVSCVKQSVYKLNDQPAQDGEFSEHVSMLADWVNSYGGIFAELCLSLPAEESCLLMSVQ